MSTIKDLKPAKVWQNFYELTQVPRPSNHEEKAQKFMLEWAKENSIEATIDAVGNIIMSKAATPGMENCKGIILQAHLDMVPQKNSDTVHDFENDPIQTYVDGEWVAAKGTTLGADNGLGLAAGMAVLTANDLPHGPIELLITATEETGMDGANGLEAGVLKGDILINLDSESEGELYVGCAGGINSVTEFTYEEESLPADSIAYKLTVKGLKGGHSGLDINLGRGNSNILLFRFLKTYAKELDIYLASIDGGSLRNAIPRESFAVIVVPKANANQLQKAIAETLAIYKAELGAQEPNLQLCIKETDMPPFVIDLCTQYRLTNSIIACPNGAVRMIDSMPDTVETSNNIAIVKSENSKVVINTLIRSSVETAKDALAQSIQAVFELAEADHTTFSGAYPGWKPNPNSTILKEMQEIYEQMYGKKPAVLSIHAGLECGLLGAKYPNWDMISCGPTICFPHSPDEKVNIPSVEKFWKYLKETLKNVPSK